MRKFVHIIKIGTLILQVPTSISDELLPFAPKSNMVMLSSATTIPSKIKEKFKKFAP